MRAPAAASRRNFARASSPAPMSSTGPACISRNTGRNRMRRSLPQLMGVDWNYFLYMSRSMPAKRKLFLLYCGATIENFAPKGQGPKMHLLDKDSTMDQLRWNSPTEGSLVRQISTNARTHQPA